MKVAVPKETSPGETRVAAVPDSVIKAAAAGLEVVVQSGAGAGANFSDEEYAAAGATVVSSAEEAFRDAEVIFKVQPPSEQEISVMPRGALLIGALQAVRHPELLENLARAGVTGMAMELIPRISRAQSMDVLSSQASIGGYKAVLVGAERLDKILPLQITAAGTLAPGRVLVLGAGVAGLQAIATAKRLGAVVEAFDVRPAVREEVESLGAKFLEIPVAAAEGTGGYAREQSEEQVAKQRELLTERVSAADVVVTTAAIPGKRAPLLITADMVAKMRPGSVVVDLAAESGGNCEVTVVGEEVLVGGVTVVGIADLPRTVPHHASQTYSRNLLNLLNSLLKDGRLEIDLEDEVVKAICVTHEGKVLYGKE